MNDDVHLRTAPEEELPALLGLWTTVFEAEPLLFTCEYFAFEPDRRKTFVAELDGKLIASVQLFGIPIRNEFGHPAMVGGLANVSTLPDHRGKGLSRSLIDLAVQEMNSKGYGWSFLFTGRNSFYEQFGWRTIHRSYLTVGLQLEIAADVHSDVVLSDPLDLARLRLLSEASFKPPLSRIRSDLDWEIRIPVRIADKVVFMDDVSYAIVRRRDAGAVLEEWGMADPSVEQFQCLLADVADWAGSTGISNLEISASILPEARQAIESLFPNVRNVEESEAMVRPLDDEWTMARLVSLFSQPDARFAKLDNF